MSQRDALRAMDAEIFASLSGTAAGGDAAVLTYKNGDTLECSVYVDYAVERFGDQGQIDIVPAVVHAFKSEVSVEPVRGTVIEIDGTVLTTDRKDSEDVSRWAYRCKAGR